MYQQLSKRYMCFNVDNQRVGRPCCNAMHTVCTEVPKGGMLLLPLLALLLHQARSRNHVKR